MSTVGFQLAAPAKSSGGMIPLTVEKALATGYAELQGALLVVDVDGKYAAAGADVTPLAAVALTPGGTDTSGFNILGHKEFPPGYMQGMSLRDTQWKAPYVGTLPSVAGGQYGYIRDTDGVYKVDFNDNINVVLTLVGIPDFSPADAAGSGQDTFVIVEFLGSAIAAI